MLWSSKIDRLSNDWLLGANPDLPQLHVAQQASFQGQGWSLTLLSLAFQCLQSRNISEVKPKHMCSLFRLSSMLAAELASSPCSPPR